MIPALEAARTVAAAIRSAPAGAEIIVVDGGSRDVTIAEAEGAGAHVLESLPGRARQLNRGAAAAGGEVLVFLHADCRLPPDAAEQIDRVLAEPGVVGGWFPQRVESGSPLLARGAPRGANLRARWLGLPYGDQAIFARRTALCAAGGFPEVPIMEDAGLVRRLRAEGRLLPASSPVTTGDDHWRRLGPVLTTVLDYAVLAAWLAGVPPRRIAPVYHRLRGTG